MSALQAKVLPFDAAANNKKPRDGNKFNYDGLPRISDDEHFMRALKSGAPLSYVAPRAGRIQYDGEDGMGSLNAESVMIRILTQPGYKPDADDVAKAHRINSTLGFAVRHMQRFYPEEYKAIAADLPNIAIRLYSGLSHG